MKISLNTKKTEATDKTIKYGCDFCNREFLRESTMSKHLCENKQRWMNKDMQGNRIGFQASNIYHLENNDAGYASKTNALTETALRYIKALGISKIEITL